MAAIALAQNNPTTNTGKDITKDPSMNATGATTPPDTGMGAVRDSNPTPSSKDANTFSGAQDVSGGTPAAPTDAQSAATTTDTATTTTAVADNQGLNTRDGFGHIAMWAVPIVILFAVAVYWFLRQRRHDAVGTSRTGLST